MDPEFGKNKGVKQKTLLDQKPSKEALMKTVTTKAFQGWRSSHEHHLAQAPGCCRRRRCRREGLSTSERASLPESMGVNKTSYAKLSATDKETFIDTNLSVLRSLRAYVMEAEPEPLSRTSLGRGKSRRRRHARRAIDAPRPGKPGEPPDRVRGPPVVGGKTAKEEVREGITAADKKEIAEFARWFGGARGA